MTLNGDESKDATHKSRVRDFDGEKQNPNSLEINFVIFFFVFVALSGIQSLVDFYLTI